MLYHKLSKEGSKQTWLGFKIKRDSSGPVRVRHRNTVQAGWLQGSKGQADSSENQLSLSMMVWMNFCLLATESPSATLSFLSLLSSFLFLLSPFLSWDELLLGCPGWS